MKRSIFSIAGILILTAVLLLANSIVSFSFGRFKIDLTEEKLFSLSSGTKNILSNLADEVTLRYYASKTDDVHPGIKVYAQRIEDLLKEYQRYAGVNLRLEIYDPEPDTDAEDWAKKYGLTPFTLPGKTPIFLGLVGSNGFGEEDTIAFFQPDRQQFLEYDLTKLIYNLSRTTKPKIGIISSVKLEGDNQMPASFPGQPQPQREEPWYFVKQLESLAEVKILANDLEKIDEDISLLMLAHPPALEDKTRFAIDQFVVAGGNLFVATDPNCQSCAAPSFPPQPEAPGQASSESSVDSLFQKWGVSLNPGKVVGNRDLAAKVGVGQGQVKEFLLWLAFSKSDAAKNSINSEDIITSELDSMIMPWAGDLKISEVEGLKSQPLIETTSNSKLYDSAQFNTINLDPDLILRDFVSENTTHIVATRLSGKFKSSFDKAPEGSPLKYRASSKESANVVIVADVDFLADTYAIAKQQFFNTEIVSLLNDNILFLQNSIENLLGSNDLISLRSRGKFSRAFERVEEIERKAQERWLDEEQALQDELNNINTRLSQLLAAQGGGNGEGSGQTIVNQAVLEEIKKFREEQKEARTRLREVRRESRKEIENMASRLFLINTFLIPLLLVVFTVCFTQFRKRKAKK